MYVPEREFKCIMQLECRIVGLCFQAQSTMPTKAVDKTGHRTRLYIISKQTSLMLVGIDVVPGRYMYLVLYPHLSTTVYDGSTANITIVF